MLKRIILFLAILTNIGIVGSANFKIDTDFKMYLQQDVNILNRDNHTKIIVLTYHLLSEDINKSSDFCITPQQFEADIKYLVENKYQLSTASMLNNVKNQKVIAITFDDGYESDYKLALPILEKYKVPATFFIIGSRIEKDGHLSKEQLKKMSDSPFVEIGNHSYSFHDIAMDEITKKMNQKNNHVEIINNYKFNSDFIYKITNKKVTSTSYPYGIYSREIDKQLKNQALKVSFSTNFGINYALCNKPLNRINRSNTYEIDKLLLNY